MNDTNKDLLQDFLQLSNDIEPEDGVVYEIKGNQYVFINGKFLPHGELLGGPGYKYPHHTGQPMKGPFGRSLPTAEQNDQES